MWTDYNYFYIKWNVVTIHLPFPLEAAILRMTINEMISCITFRMSLSILSSNFIYVTLIYSETLKYSESLNLEYVNTTISLFKSLYRFKLF